MIQRIIIFAYALVLGLLFGILFSAQLLAFLGLYEAIFVLPLTALTTVGITWLYLRSQPAWFAVFQREGWAARADLRHSALALAMLLLGLVFLFRMFLWPASSLGDIIPGDAISYHFIKMIELVRTGSMWDLTIPYGEYPIGYESLTAISLLLTGNLQGLGFAHALIMLFLILTLTLMICRYTPMPAAFSLLIATGVCFYPALYSQILVLGKNDLLLSTSILAAVLHSPLGTRDDHAMHPLGLAFVTHISLSTKANGLFILVLLWLLVLWEWYMAYRRGEARQRMHPLMFVSAIVLMFPSGLWVIRNYLLMGRFFSPEISGFFTGSIIANLNNPDLYQSGYESQTFLQIIGFYVLFTLGLLLTRRIGWRFVLLLAMMLFAFFITPLGAFHTLEKHTLHIEWRYTTHSFLMIFVLGLALLTPILTRLHNLLFTRTLWVRTAQVLMLLGFIGIMLVLRGPDLLRLNQDNVRMLQDPFAEPVGEGGYWSLYAYVQENVQGALLYYERVEPYYLYDRNYSNAMTPGAVHPLGIADAVSHPDDPDYLVIGLPAYANLATNRFYTDPQMQWELVYEDSVVGRVYQRIREDQGPT